MKQLNTPLPALSATAAALCAAALLSGCGKNPAPAPAPAPKEPDPGYVVAMVGQTPLTWEAMDRRAMGYMRDAVRQEHLIIPSNKLEEAKTYFRRKSVSAFVFRTVLLDEAAREKLSLTKSDIASSLSDLAAALKARNWTTNDFFNNGPLPPGQMRAEFEAGALIDKLFRLKAAPQARVTAAEINELIGTVFATNDAKRARLEGIREKIAAGASFEETAAKVSECAKSKNRGGDIGAFSRGQLGKELEEAAFALPVGGISRVVQSNAGFHILKVTAKTPARPKTAAEPARPETVRLSHIFLKKVPVRRKAAIDTIRTRKFEAAKAAYYKKLRAKHTITCFLYPDMIFQ